MTRRAPDGIAQELDRVRSLSPEELRIEWARHYRAPPPRITRDLLILGITYRLQERAYGGLGRAAQRKLTAIAASLRSGDQVQVTPKLNLKLGSRLVREWQGRMHVVTVVDHGYEHEGIVSDSLSSIAKKITGVHRSGPRFFGLLGAKPAPGQESPR